MSEVWLYFTKSGAVATCNGCDFVAKETRDNRLKTSALWRHLQSKHPDVYERSAYGAEHPSERKSAGDGPPQPKTAKVDGALPNSDGTLQLSDPSIAACSAEADAEPASSKALLNRTNILTKMPCKKVVDEAGFRRAASAGPPTPVPMPATLLSTEYATASRGSLGRSSGGGGLSRAKTSSSKRSSFRPTDNSGAPRSSSSASDSGRRRINFTAEQQQILEDAFKRNAFVSGEERTQLAAALQEPEERVRIWFQNRRMKEKNIGDVGRPRTVFTPAQLNVLKDAFKQSPCISPEERANLAATLNVPEETVRVWFQNRRVRQKTDSELDSTGKESVPRVKEEAESNGRTHRLAASLPCISRTDSRRHDVVRGETAVNGDKESAETNAADVKARPPTTEEPKLLERPRRNTASLMRGSFTDALRLRTTFSAEQVQHLEESFKRSQTVSLEERSQLAQQLGMTEETVKIWFKNCRAKEKNASLSGSNADDNEADLCTLDGNQTTDSVNESSAPTEGAKQKRVAESLSAIGEPLAARSAKATPFTAPTSKGSEVWRYFSKPASSEDIVCKLCENELPRRETWRATTSPMWEHLRSHHREVYRSTDFNKKRSEGNEAVPKIEKPGAVRADDRRSSWSGMRSSSGTPAAQDRGFDDRLIDEIQRHPFLYGGGHCPHGGNPKRIECWETLAKTLGLPADQARSRWKTLRDVFVKEQRKVDAGRVPRWRLYEKMVFLKPLLRGVEHEMVKLEVSDHDDGDDDDTEQFFAVVKEKFMRLSAERMEAVKSKILESVAPGHANNNAANAAQLPTSTDWFGE